MEETRLLVGRPYGGCAIMWRSSLDCVFDPIETSSKRLVAGIMSISGMRLLLCNAYMPCDGDYADPLGVTYSEVIGNAHAIIDTCCVDNVIFAGDMNTDLRRTGSPHVPILRSMAKQLGLFFFF